MKRKHICVWLGLSLMTLLGCQASQAPREKDKQANAYIEQAQAYESQGNLVEALEQYKLAQTIDPNEPVITDSVNRIEKQLDDLAETHYQAGLRFRDKGKWQLAKKEFLKALRYRPEHKKAATMLQQCQPEEARKYISHEIAPGESLSKLALKYYGNYKKYHHIANFNNMSDATRVRVGQATVKGEYTVHQIQPGESLSRVAQIYYGDYKLFHVIAKYNDIADPTSIKVGQKVKVPRLESVSSPITAAAEPAPEISYTPEAVEAEPVAEAPEPDELPKPDASEPVDQVADYRETGIALFNEKKYDEAIVELQKVLSAAPDDADAIVYISLSYVELGRGHLAARRLNEAKTAFTTALDYDDNCRDCQDLLAQCRTIEADSLKKEGETLFQNNQFDKAISTLERSVALNPNDAAATDLLFQTLFQKALIFYNKQDYLAAKTGFGKAAVIKPGCRECKQYIEKSMEAYMEFHYNEGIVFFGQEELKKAIASWEKVAAVDPDYKDVQQNLKKATLLNDRLERIKKSVAE
ncbi:MAG: tetratricopeptide repeat protein [Desulfosarcina sp.]|nr:tetratricopeptide repeat protein [Desulfosarcina sp.]